MRVAKAQPAQFGRCVRVNDTANTQEIKNWPKRPDIQLIDHDLITLQVGPANAGPESGIRLLEADLQRVLCFGFSSALLFR